MLIKEGRDKIRTMCFRFKKKPSINMALDMLDALDEMGTMVSGYKKAALEHKGLYAGAIIDRDRWKTRAEAMERALNQSSRCNNPKCTAHHPCQTCVKFSRSNMPTCKSGYNKDGWPNYDIHGFVCPEWQFDEARFAGGKEDA